MDQKSSSVNVADVSGRGEVVPKLVADWVRRECWVLSVGSEERRQERVTARAELVRAVKSLMCS